MVHPLRTPEFAFGATMSMLLLASSIGGNVRCDAFTSTRRPSMVHRSSPTSTTTTALLAKKKKGNTPGPNYSNKKGGGQPQQEKASVREARFDAATRQFMFTLVGLTKTLPDKSKDILKNINLSFYPGAKIGVVGLNGSGKVR
jgi:ABC-type multidrug transport system fused ATPase/permease subunit